MKFSDQVDKLFPAIIAAWRDIPSAAKNATNPHLKNHYADLVSIMDAVKPSLAAHGLAALQPVGYETLADGTVSPVIETYIIHTSGQWMMEPFSMASLDKKPQTVGATITYARRYALGGMLSMVAEMDDDGNSGSLTTGPKQQHRPAPQTKKEVNDVAASASQAVEIPRTETDIARDLRNKLIEISGADHSVVRAYFTGIWPEGTPKDSAAYIKPLNSIIQYVSRGDEEKARFKAEAEKLGQTWRSSQAPADVNSVADAVAKRYKIGSGPVLLKTIEKMYKGVDNDADALLKFLQIYLSDETAFDRLQENAANKIPLQDWVYG